MSSQKNPSEKAKTRMKTATAPSTAAAKMSTETATVPKLASHTQEILDSENDQDVTLGMILKKLEKLEKLEALEAKLETLTQTTETFLQSTGSMVKKTAEEVTVLAGRVDRSDRQQKATDRALAIMDNKLSRSEETNRRLMLQMNEMENRARETSLKIEGKREQEGEDLYEFVAELAHRITPHGLDQSAIVSARRLGKYRNPQAAVGQKNVPKPRSILVTFKTVQDRNKLYYARTKLRNSEQHKAIYLNDDATLMTKKMREDFRSVAALARRNDKEVRIHDDGIILDGKKYKHGDADQLPSDYTVQKAKTVKIGEGLYFQSEHSFLSNFYPSPINLDNKYYPTAEHRLQAVKCEMAKDSDRHERILTAHTPQEAKRIGDQVNESPEWRQAREIVLAELMDEKFDQNDDLAGKLISTGKLTLHEVTANSFYGIGAALHSREMRNNQFTGMNKLGHALMEKRDKMTASRDIVVKINAPVDSQTADSD